MLCSHLSDLRAKDALNAGDTSDFAKTAVEVRPLEFVVGCHRRLSCLGFRLGFGGVGSRVAM